MDDKTRALLGDHEATKLAHLSLFSGIGGASGRTTRQRFWKNTGRTCRAGGIFVH